MDEYQIEICRLTGVFQQRGADVLIRTAADELVKLRRAIEELKLLRSLALARPTSP